MCTIHAIQNDSVQIEKDRKIILCGVRNYQNLFICRQERNENLLTAGKHSELLRKVESLAALTDSNKLLREEKERLAAVVDTAKCEADQAKQKILPLETRIKVCRTCFIEALLTLLFMPTAILAEAYCFRRVLKNLACFEKSFLCFSCLKILHRTQIC